MSTSELLESPNVRRLWNNHMNEMKQWNNTWTSEELQAWVLCTPADTIGCWYVNDSLTLAELEALLHLKHGLKPKSRESRGAQAEQFAAEIRERQLTYDQVQALWHAASWHLVTEAKNARPSVVKARMATALESMPLEDPVEVA